MSTQGLERHRNRWRFRVTVDGRQKWLNVPASLKTEAAALEWMDRYKQEHRERMSAQRDLDRASEAPTVLEALAEAEHALQVALLAIENIRHHIGASNKCPQSLDQSLDA